jgi:hypothetical protein
MTIVTTDVTTMTDADLTQYLIDTADVPESAKQSYAAGYFESTILTLMLRYPEVRKDIEDRVKFRMKVIA